MTDGSYTATLSTFTCFLPIDIVTTGFESVLLNPSGQLFKNSDIILEPSATDWSTLTLSSATRPLTMLTIAVSVFPGSNGSIHVNSFSLIFVLSLASANILVHPSSLCFVTTTWSSPFTTAIRSCFTVEQMWRLRAHIFMYLDLGWFQLCLQDHGHISWRLTRWTCLTISHSKFPVDVACHGFLSKTPQ